MPPLSRYHDFLEHSQFRRLAIACIFEPFRFTAPDGSERLAMQQLQASDVESECMLGHYLLEREPRPVTAAEVIAFMEIIFAKHGKPREGVIILPSVWCSTVDLLAQPVTHGRVAWLEKAGVHLAAMDAGHRYALAEHLEAAGLDLAWSEEQIENLNELLDH